MNLVLEEHLKLDNSRHLRIWQHPAGVSLEIRDLDGKGSTVPVMSLTLPVGALGPVIDALQTAAVE